MLSHYTQRCFSSKNSLTPFPIIYLYIHYIIFYFLEIEGLVGCLWIYSPIFQPEFLVTSNIFPELYTSATTWETECNKIRCKKLKVVLSDVCSNMVLQLLSQKKKVSLYPKSRDYRILNSTDFENVGTFSVLEIYHNILMLANHRFSIVSLVISAAIFLLLLGYISSQSL